MNGFTYSVWACRVRLSRTEVRRRILRMEFRVIKTQKYEKTAVKTKQETPYGVSCLERM
jgi:hypothetical protein